MLRHIGNKTVHKIHTIRSGMAGSHDCHYMPAVQITFAKPIQHQWGVIAIRQPHRIIIICIVQRPYAVSIHKISLPARLLKNGSTISPVKKLIGKSQLPTGGPASQKNPVPTLRGTATRRPTHGSCHEARQKPSYISRCRSWSVQAIFTIVKLMN